MSDSPPLRLVEAEDPGSSNETAQIFVRTIAVPPGMPWDQARAAHLEARVGAPLPSGELLSRLRRVERWRPGAPARFASFYVRAKDVVTQLKTRAVINGREVEVTFVSPALRRRQARTAGLSLVAGGGAFVALLASLAVAISAKATSEAQLAALEQLGNARARLAASIEASRHQARELDLALMGSQPLSDEVADLDWASSAKAPGAQITSVHWERELMAVEARGDSAPFVSAGRQVTRVGKPLRPDVWLWGLTNGQANGHVAPPALGSAP